MNIESIKSKIAELNATFPLSRAQKIYLGKLKSAERLETHVAPHLRTVNGHDVDFVFTETNDDLTSDYLDWNGIDGLLQFRFAGVAAAYANRTWTQTEETPHCGGALIRFCRDRGTKNFEMALRSQRQNDQVDQFFIDSEPMAENYVNPRPVRFQEEAMRFMSNRFMGLSGSFSPDYFISSYFGKKEDGGACLRFSAVSVADLCDVLSELYSEIPVGNSNLLSFSRSIVGMWRAPYLVAWSEFQQIEDAIERHPGAALVQIKDGQKGKFVRFLYLKREYLEARCPSFQIWEGGVLQPRPAAMVSSLLVADSPVTFEDLPVIGEIDVIPGPASIEPPSARGMPSEVSHRRSPGLYLSGVAALALLGLCGLLAFGLEMPISPPSTLAQTNVVVTDSSSVKPTAKWEAAPPSVVAPAKKRLHSASVIGGSPAQDRGVMTIRTAPAIREAARQALSGGTVRWISGAAFGFAALASAGTFDERGCPRFRVSRNDLVTVDFQEYTLCEVLVPK